jgi:eukaryotic-like serine/threonine-protein kinase
MTVSPARVTPLPPRVSPFAESLLRSATVATGLSLERGALIGGDFVVVRLLGQGGMGSVYVAEQRSTGKLRALKVMHREMTPDATHQRRFEQEAKVGALIKSGHIVEVIAAGVDAGLPYLVMELLEGVDLGRYLGQKGRLEAGEIRPLFEQLCHGVGAAHAMGIVHRDLKPENIFLAHSHRAGGQDSVVKVLDFGIAKLAAEAGTRSTAAIGSPLWMAPEQTTPGNVTPAADVWALGLIAYELFAGEHFWRSAAVPTATPMHLLREIVLDPIPPASDRAAGLLPQGFDAWFKRCLARAPGDRFHDATELWLAMQTFLPNAESARASSQRGLGVETDPLAATAAASPYDSLPPSPKAHTQATTHAPLVVVEPHASTDAARGTLAQTSRGISRNALLVASGIGLAGVFAGAFLARRPPETAGVRFPSPQVPNVTDVPSIPSIPSSAPSPPQPAGNQSAEVAPLLDGFANPSDGERQPEDMNAAQQTVVQGRHVRLLTRIVSNGSNVIDPVVRSAIDHSAWRYTRCYESAFKSAKDFTGGIITVAFDILDQLPMHAALVSSSFTDADINRCVVRTLSGQTMNAARAKGAGHVVYAFRFVLTD